MITIILVDPTRPISHYLTRIIQGLNCRGLGEFNPPFIFQPLQLISKNYLGVKLNPSTAFSGSMYFQFSFIPLQCLLSHNFLLEL